MKHSSSIFGGMGIGLLIGFLIGLTTSGIVGVIIGTLTTILLAYLGIKEEGSTESNAMRIGAFGIFCILGILGGLFMRVTNAFVPNPSDQVALWMQDSLFTNEEAKRYYLYDRFAFLPKGQEIDTTKDRKSGRTTLYGIVNSESDCSKLESYEDFSLENKLEAYADLGPSWKTSVENINQLATSPEEKERMLELLKSLCDE